MLLSQVIDDALPFQHFSVETIAQTLWKAFAESEDDAEMSKITAFTKLHNDKLINGLENWRNHPRKEWLRMVDKILNGDDTNLPEYVEGAYIKKKPGRPLGSQLGRKSETLTVPPPQTLDTKAQKSTWEQFMKITNDLKRKRDTISESLRRLDHEKQSCLRDYESNVKRIDSLKQKEYQSAEEIEKVLQEHETKCKKYVDDISEEFGMTFEPATEVESR